MNGVSSQQQLAATSNEITLLQGQLRELEESHRYYKHLFETQQKLLEEKKSECVQLRVALEQQRNVLLRELEKERENHAFTKLQLEDETRNVNLGIQTIRRIQAESKQQMAKVKEQTEKLLLEQQRKFEKTIETLQQEKNVLSVEKKAMEQMVNVLKTQLQHITEQKEKFENILKQQQQQQQQQMKSQYEFIHSQSEPSTVVSQQDKSLDGSLHSVSTNTTSQTSSTTKSSPSQSTFSSSSSSSSSWITSSSVVKTRSLNLLEEIQRDLETTEQNISRLLHDNKNKILSPSTIEQIQQRIHHSFTFFLHTFQTLSKEFDHEKEVNNFLLFQLQNERSSTENFVSTIKELQQQIDILSDQETKSSTYCISYIDVLPEIKQEICSEETKSTQNNNRLHELSSQLQ